MAANNYSLLHIAHFSGLSKWSAQDTVFDNVDNRFPLVPLSKILTRVKEAVDIEDETLYKRITVRLYGQGVLQRDEVLGKEIGTKRQFVAHAGQLIISRIDARNGALGIVPEELEGSIVTNDFWLFEVHNALPEYLMLVLSSELFQQYWQTQSSGTTNRQRVSEDSFLESKIALPPIQEQSHLSAAYIKGVNKAALYDTAAKKISEEISNYLYDELGIKQKSTIDHSGIISFITFSSLYQWGVDKNLTPFPFVFEKYKAFSFSMKPTWVKSLVRGKSPQYSLTGSSIILNQKCNRMDHIDISYAKPVDSSWLEKLDKDFLTRENDILINSTGEGTLGRASRITKEYEGLAYDSHMLLLRVNSEEVDAQLIVDLINSPFGQKQVEIYKSAQATKQTELGIENTKKILFPLPNLSEQERISATIEERKHQMNSYINSANELRIHAKKEFEKNVFG